LKDARVSIAPNRPLTGARRRLSKPAGELTATARFPTTVAYPFGSSVMKSWALAARVAGLTIPHDRSVASCYARSEAEILVPSLTTLMSSATDDGATAEQLALAVAEDGPTPASKTLPRPLMFATRPHRRATLFTEVGGPRAGMTPVVCLCAPFDQVSVAIHPLSPHAHPADATQVGHHDLSLEPPDAIVEAARTPGTSAQHGERTAGRAAAGAINFGRTSPWRPARFEYRTNQRADPIWTRHAWLGC